MPCLHLCFPSWSVSSTGEEPHSTTPHVSVALTPSMEAQLGARGCLGTRASGCDRTFQMCVVLCGRNQLVLQKHQLRNNKGRRRIQCQCHKTFISLGISRPALFSFRRRPFPFPTPGHILGEAMPSHFGWATPKCLLCRALQGA